MSIFNYSYDYDNYLLFPFSYFFYSLLVIVSVLTYLIIFTILLFLGGEFLMISSLLVALFLYYIYFLFITLFCTIFVFVFGDSIFIYLSFMLMLMFIWFGDVLMGALTVVYNYGIYYNMDDYPYCLCSMQSDDLDYNYSTWIYCLIQLIELYSGTLYLIFYSLL